MYTCLNKPAVVFKTNWMHISFSSVFSTVFREFLWHLHADGKNVSFVKAVK